MDFAEQNELSERERAVLKLATEGLTDDAIAHALGIARSTVLTYWNRIRKKIGSEGRARLVAISVREEVAEFIESLTEEKEECEAALEASQRRLEAIERRLDALKKDGSRKKKPD